MAETKMKLGDCEFTVLGAINVDWNTPLNLRKRWLDDLCVRFIINLPQEELESVERICFQVEEAQWYYEDFARPLDPTLPHMSLQTFCLSIFQHCPLLSQFSHHHHLAAFSEFLAYKTRVPVRGAILLNESMDEVLLVKGWKKGSSWSFPRGKINKDEKDLDCAIREVYEETGFHIREAGLVRDEENTKYIEITMREQNIRLYVFKAVSMETRFAPRTRKEISKIEWHRLAELPTFKKSKQQQQQHGQGQDSRDLVATAHKFYMVAPFLVPLKAWIAQQKKHAARESRASQPVSGTQTEDLMTEEEPATESEAILPQSLPTILQKSQPQPTLPEVTKTHTSTEEASAMLRSLLSVQPPRASHPLPPKPTTASVPGKPPLDAKSNILLSILKGSGNGEEDKENKPNLPVAIRNLPEPSHELPSIPPMPGHDPHQAYRPLPDAHQPLRMFPAPPIPLRPSNLPSSSSTHQRHSLPSPTKSYTPSQDQLPLSTRPAQPPRHLALQEQPKNRQLGEPAIPPAVPPAVDFSNVHAPIIPSGSRLPAPRLTNHTLSLLEMLKPEDSTAARSSATVGSIEPAREVQRAQKEIAAFPDLGLGYAKQHKGTSGQHTVIRNDIYAGTHLDYGAPTAVGPSTFNTINHRRTAQSLERHHAQSAASSATPVELSAQRSPGLRQPALSRQNLNIGANGAVPPATPIDKSILLGYLESVVNGR
ncbi:MAG: hypothetical protein M1825_003417 [Sarcosagium campestre]|nr:MAG: hypothetical protein M1825_003417 [Sarcosagium campestre]